ncbi:MAG: threonine/serine exporter family protein, partial [Phycisphaerales bacterium]|nr:threonine/serine exporter family protein [Phycisphaerales bacterium]
MVSRLDIPVTVTPSAETWSDPETRGVVSFLLRIGRALHRYGTPAHRLEASLEELAERLGLHGQFFATPTSLFIALGEMNEQRTYLLRVEPGEVNLGKLSALDEIVERVAHRELDPVDAERQIQAVEEQPPHFGTLVSTIAQVVSCAGAAIFFGGRWREACLAGLVGLILGMLWAMLVNRRRALRLFETLAGMISATIAVIGSWLWGGEVSASIVTVSGIIMLVPGLTMTVAINELATRNLASGTARLMGGLTILTALGFGAAIGLRLQTIFPLALMPPQLVIAPIWIELPIVFLSALAFTVAFQARLRDAPWILLTSILALY